VIYGWWLNQLLEALYKEINPRFEFPKNAQIFFPRRNFKFDKEWKRMQRMLQGCFFIWLERGDKTKALITMKCL